MDFGSQPQSRSARMLLWALEQASCTPPLLRWPTHPRFAPLTIAGKALLMLVCAD